MNLRTMLKSVKMGILVPPQLKDAGAFAGNTYFDCLGLSGVLVLMIVGTTDIAAGSNDSSTAPKLEECDETGGTYTAVPSAELSAVIGAGDDDKLFGIFVDRTKTRKRYLQIDDPTAGDGTNGVNMAAIAIGFPAEQMPASAAEMGLEEFIEA